MIHDFTAVVGSTLSGRYKVLRLVGSGGMGAVYEALQLDLQRSVALKIIVGDDPRAIARLRQEAITAGSLHNPHVVTVFDFQHNPGEAPFLVMELLAGESLWSLLRREGILAPPRALKIATQILLGLDAAHRAGITHRDIKPANVWLVATESGDVHVKLLDFGVAKLPEESGGIHTTTGDLLGTPSYLSPEQLRGQPIDRRSDLHAVGVVLYEMLSGARPWEHTGATAFLEILERTPRPLRMVVPTVSLEVSWAVDRALAKLPEHRFQTAMEMVKALAVESPAPTIPTTGIPVPMPTDTIADLEDRTIRQPRAATAPNRTRVFFIALFGVLLLGNATLALVLRSKAFETPDVVLDAGNAATPTGDAEPPSSEASVVAVDEDSMAPLSSASSETQTSPRKVSSNQCSCMFRNRGLNRTERLCLKPIVNCSCAFAFQVTTAQLCPNPWPPGPSGWQNCPDAHSYGRPGARNGDRCVGYRMLDDGRSVETKGVLDCTYCEGPRLYPGTRGQPCRGVNVNGTSLDGVWECP
jgi:serine/threonine protein kinase